MIPQTFMARTECFVNRRGRYRCTSALLGAATVLLVVAGCGSSVAGSGESGPSGATVKSTGGHVLSVVETKAALRSLPYRITLRAVPLPQGATGAVAGRAVGQHHTVLHFGIALGRRPSPVPGIGAEIVGYEGGGFVYTDDTLIAGKHEKWETGPQFHTAAQWHEGGHMGVEITEALCVAATGHVCPVGG